MQNEAQYDLDWKATKISPLSSNNLDKYEYLTSEYLGLKPSTVEQAKFEYSLLGKIINKGLDKNDQKEGLFKRLNDTGNAQKYLIRNDNESIYYIPRSEYDDKYKKKQQQQYRHKTPKCLQLFKNFNSKGKRFDRWKRRCKWWYRWW